MGHVANSGWKRPNKSYLVAFRKRAKRTKAVTTPATISCQSSPVDALKSRSSTRDYAHPWPSSKLNSRFVTRLLTLSVQEKLDSGRHLYDETMMDAVNSFDRHGLLTPIKRAKTEVVKAEVPKLGALIQQLRTLLQRCGSLNQRSSISTIQQLVTAAEKAIKQLESLRRTVEDEETKHTRYEKDAERRR